MLTTLSLGMVYADPDSAYMRLMRPFLEKKKQLGVDKWGRDDREVGHLFEPLIERFRAEIPARFHTRRYPHHWRLDGHVHRVLREMLLSEWMTWEYASYFEGKTLEDLDELAASFKFENCRRRDGLNDILKKDAGVAS